ncbi:tetratricopeptide repeat protein [Methylomicrobium lacus]|uniref:tetratricopeptide repeat protein n=1 Tax=Methylomicrobium lacus TaxID=136992 RepID=UPI0035A9424F
MMQKRFILLCVLPAVLPGCASLYEQQSPAPVYGGPAPVYRQRPVQAPLPPPVPIPEPTVKTTPIPEFNQQVVPIAPAPVPAPAPMPGEGGDSLGLLPDAETSVAAGAVPDATLPVSAPETYAAPPFQPIEPSASSSPAVGALVTAANQNSQTGNLDSAIATIERARSIEPNNAGLYYKLALLRIKQGKPKLAEELAKKAALLAQGDRHLKKHSWLLIAHAREMQKDFDGAQAARDKAAGF